MDNHNNTIHKHQNVHFVFTKEQVEFLDSIGKIFTIISAILIIPLIIY